MKKILYSAVVIILMVFMLIAPREALDASKTGLLLWSNTILPTLLPFMILSNLIIHLNIVSYITFFFAPVLSRLLGISRNGCYAFLIGFLCGYPMGAKVTADMTVKKMINKEEGQYLLGFCNNVSPTFLITFVVIESLSASALLAPTLIIAYAAPLTYALITGRRMHSTSRNNSYTSMKKRPLKAASIKKTKSQINFSLVDTCIMDGFENITKLGGYIILFSLISKLILVLPLNNPFIKYSLVGLVEITNGIQGIASSPLPLTMQYIMLMAALTFGGLSSIAQTESMIKKSGLSIKKYITAKSLTMLFAALYAFIYVIIKKELL